MNNPSVLFPVRTIVRCACGAVECTIRYGYRDGVVYITSDGLADAIEHDRRLRRQLAVLLARARDGFKQ